MAARVWALTVPVFAAVGCSLVIDTIGLSGASPADAAADDVSDVDAPGADASDAGGDGPAKLCDPRQPFGVPVLLASLSTAEAEGNPRLTADELTITFGRSAGTSTTSDLYISTRATSTEPFPPPVLITELNSSTADQGPALGEDGLSLVFTSTRGGGPGGADLFRAVRSTRSAAFTSPTVLSAAINSASFEVDPFVVQGELWFVSDRDDAGSADIYRSPNVELGPVVRVAELASPDSEGDPTLSADRLVVMFSSNRTGGGAKGSTDIWVARRSTPDGPFEAPTNVAELNTAFADVPGWLTPDGCRVYLASDRPGGAGSMDIYIAERQAP